MRIFWGMADKICDGGRRSRAGSLGGPWGGRSRKGVGRRCRAPKGRVESCLAEGHTTREIQIVGLWSTGQPVRLFLGARDSGLAVFDGINAVNCFLEDFAFGTCDEAFNVFAVAQDDRNGYNSSGKQEWPEVGEVPVGVEGDSGCKHKREDEGGGDGCERDVSPDEDEDEPDEECSDCAYCVVGVKAECDAETGSDAFTAPEFKINGEDMARYGCAAGGEGQEQLWDSRGRGGQ